MKAVLRELERKDLDNMMTWVNDPDIMKNFARFHHKFTRAEEAVEIDKLLSDKRNLMYAFEAEDGTYLGNVGLQEIYKPFEEYPAYSGRLSIIEGNKNYHGRGYGQSALQQIIEKGFEDLKLRRIWAKFFEENTRMKHILTKLGFKEEGVHYHEYIDSNFVEHNMVHMYRMNENSWTQEVKM